MAEAMPIYPVNPLPYYRKAKPMPNERGEEWERLRQRVIGFIDGYTYGYETASVEEHSALADYMNADAAGLDAYIRGSDMGRIDAATDYLWSLGVRG